MAMVITTVVGLPSAAFADPAVPTHYRSTVTAHPVADASFEVEVLGGDAFLLVRAPGRKVEIPGYEGEPYVRIHPDGRVEINDRSPARWLNDARYGARDVVVPPSADAAAIPVWTQVGDGGEYAWHDHRIHFMSPQLPRHIDPSRREVQQVFDWAIPMVVDGVPITIEGRLEWVPGPSVSQQVPVAVIALLAGLLGAAWWKRGRWPSSITPMVASCGVALGVGLGAVVGLPLGADGRIAPVVLPAVAAAMVVVARRMEGARRLVVLATAVVPMLGWVGIHLDTFVRPILPNVLPPVAVRSGVAWVAVVVVFATIRYSVEIRHRRAHPTA